MGMTHAFAYANFDPLLSLEVVLLALNFSIYICRCARQVPLPMAIANGSGVNQVLSLMEAGGGTNQVMSSVA